jgi:hypothetical protein
MSFLNDAAWRLKKAEECLKMSHGENLERIMQLKGSVGPELILWCRLYLLQGIMQYHAGNSQFCKDNLMKASNIIQRLNIDETSMASLIGMGFTQREARYALRSHPQNVEAAAALILQKKEEKRLRREEDERKEEERQQQIEFGKTSKGHWVDFNLLQILNQQLGFEKRLVIEALKQTDNQQDEALTLLTQNSNLLEMAVSTASVPSLPPDSREKVQQIEQMGFSTNLAIGTLKQTKFNVERALELLLAGNGIEASNQEIETFITRVIPHGEISSTLEVPSSDFEGHSDDKGETQDQRMEKEERRLKRKAERELTEVVPQDEDAYLDGTLEEEKSILDQYLQLLSSNKQ